MEDEMTDKMTDEMVTATSASTSTTSTIPFDPFAGFYPSNVSAGLMRAVSRPYWWIGPGPSFRRELWPGVCAEPDHISPTTVVSTASGTKWLMRQHVGRGLSERRIISLHTSTFEEEAERRGVHVHDAVLAWADAILKVTCPPVLPGQTWLGYDREADRWLYQETIAANVVPGERRQPQLEHTVAVALLRGPGAPWLDWRWRVDLSPGEVHRPQRLTAKQGGDT